MPLLHIEGRLTRIRARRGARSYDHDLSFRSRQGAHRLRRVHVPPLLAPFLDQGREGTFCFQTLCGHAALYGVRCKEGSHMAATVLPQGMMLHFGLALLLSSMAALSHLLLHFPALTCLLAVMALYHLAHLLHLAYVLRAGAAPARLLAGSAREPIALDQPLPYAGLPERG